MGQSYPTIATGSDLGSSVFDNLVTRADTLRTNFSGSSAPGSPVVGQFFVEDAGGVDALSLYCDNAGTGNAWRGVALQRLTFDLNFDPDSAEGRGASVALKQALGLRLENRGTHPTIAAGNLGFLWTYTGGSDNQPYYSDGASRCGLLNAVDSSSSGSYDDVPIDAHSLWLDATNPPTLKALGNAVGWLFDATNEKIAIPARVPLSWRADSDIVLRLLCWIDGAETASDVIEWEGTCRAVTPAVDAVDKATTALATSSTPIGAVTGAGSLFECDIVLDFDDATNPIARGDLVVVTLNRKTVGGAGKVAGVVLAGASLLYRQQPRHAKA